MHGSPTKRPTLSNILRRSGFSILEQVFNEPESRALCDEMERCESLAEHLAAQSLLKTSELVRQTAQLPEIISPLSRHLGHDVLPFSAFFLDKSTESNWQMPWHQNLRIPVADAAGAPGLIENGVPHIIPDADYLTGVIIVRISLDAQNQENGALEVIPGSHQRGILSGRSVEETGQNKQAVCPALQPGDVFLFHALLVHRSRPSLISRRRRVLQIEYAAAPPAGFRWFGF